MTNVRQGVVVAVAASVAAVFAVGIMLTLTLPAGHARLIWAVGAPLGLLAGIIGGVWLAHLPDDEFDRITSGEKARAALTRIHHNHHNPEDTT